MSFGPEMRSEEIVYFGKAALPLPGRLMGVFRSIVQITTLAVKDARQNHLLRGSITAKFIGDDHARFPLGRTQQLPKDQDGSSSIQSRPHENVNHRPVLIHRAPQVMLHAIDLHFV
jgi:hypothetical protein